MHSSDMINQNVYILAVKKQIKKQVLQFGSIERNVSPSLLLFLVEDRGSFTSKHTPLCVCVCVCAREQAGVAQTKCVKVCSMT